MGFDSSLSWQRPQSAIPIVMFTGFNAVDLQQYTKDVSNLNGVMANQCAQATHLVVDTIERTAKLLKCISTCQYIVHVKWILDSRAEGRFKGWKMKYTLTLFKTQDHIF